MSKNRKNSYCQVVLMIVLVLSIVFGTARIAKADNEVTVDSNYNSSGKAIAKDVIRNDILPQMFPGIGRDAKNLQITYLVHFRDGDYYFENATGKFTKAKGTLSQIAKGYEYKVTFNANGGKVSTSNKYYKNNQKLGELPTPTKEGYSFSGWYTKKKNGTKVTKSTKCTKSITLYAHWKAKSSGKEKKAIFKLIVKNGKLPKGSSNKIPVTSGKKIGKLPKPKSSRVGYKFKGWYTKSGKLFVSKKTLVEESDAKNQTLTAKWEKVKYKITFIKQDKNDPLEPAPLKTVKFTVTDKVDLSKYKPSTPYYTFKGWINNETLKKITEIKKGTAKNITLYPRLEQHYYKIKFRSLTGTVNNPDIRRYAGEDVTLPAADVVPPKDMVFDCWKCKENNQTYQDKASFPSLTNNNGVVYTFMAQWKPAYQKALWFMDAVKISQVPGGDYSHAGTLNFDVVGHNNNSNIKAPFDCTIVNIYTGYACGNTVVIQSDKPVLYADGTVDFMSIAFAHDNNISDLYVGKALKQGDVFYQTGRYGNAQGVHSHVTCIKGKYKNNLWKNTTLTGISYCPDQINPVNALFTGNAAIIDTKGLKFKKE